MFSFDPKSRILKVQKIPEPELELNLLEYQRESYNKYVTETVYNDMQYLVQAMRDLLPVSQVEAEFRVESLYRGNYRREVKKQFPSYYPVYAKFTIQSQGISKDEIYRQINSIVSDALMYQFQETTGRSGEFIYIPSDLTTFKQVNPIAGPTVISFIDGWDFKSGHAISAFSVGGAQLETARMVAGYEGINSDGTTTKLYAYADLLPEGTHIIDMFTSVEEAAKNGYYYDPVYMG